MNREFACVTCGLFFFESIDYVNKMSYSYTCPSCSNTHVYAVDTFGYAYFCEGNTWWKEMQKWTSFQYSPETAIETYKKHGFEIR